MLNKLLIVLTVFLSANASGEYISPLIYKGLDCADLIGEYKGQEANRLDSKYNAGLVFSSFSVINIIAVLIVELEVI